MLKRIVILKKILAFLVLFSSCVLYAEELDASSEKNDAESTALSWDAIDAPELVFYVEKILPSNLATKKAMGTKEEPFPSIDDALCHISLLKKTKKKLKVLLNVRGGFSSNHSYIISCPIKIVGLSLDEEKKEVSRIRFGKNAGFFLMSSSFLMIENIHINRRELIGEPRTVPIFYALNSHLSLKNVSIDAREGGLVFMLYDSQFFMQNMSISSVQNSYSSILQSVNSKGAILASNIKCSSRSIIAMDIDRSNIILENIYFDATSSYFNFFARVFDSHFLIKNSNVLAKGNGKKEAAIMCNDKTEFLSKNLKVEGFASEKIIKNTKTGYMER